MDTPSRLEQILSTYEVEGGHLNRECPRVVAIKIAEKVLDWKMLGYVLGLPREKVLAIDRDNQTEDQRKVAMFDEWKSFKGSDSTYLKLAEALCVRNRIDIVELLCNLFQSHVTTPTEMASPEEQPNVLAEAGKCNTALERTASLENKFRALHSQFVSELTRQGTVSVDTILQALTMLPVTLKTEYDESVQQRLTVLEEATSVRRLFLRLNPLFTFIDFPGLLHYLISRFGSETLKRDMISYEQEIQVFMHKTTVAELMDHWPGRQVTNYATMRVKFDGDPQNYTLQKLNDFRRKFACKLRLSEFIFTLIGSERSNSFIALWAVHSVIAHVIIENSHQIRDEFYQCEGVLSLHVGEIQLYPSKGSSIDILHPLCELTSRWLNCQDDLIIDPTAQPVYMDGSVYTKGTSDGKKTPWKLSTLTGCWSQLSPPKGIEIEDYVITTYQGRLIWIGGMIHKSKYERNPSRKIFVLKDAWTEDTDFIPPLPESVTSTNSILASSDGKNLIIVTSPLSNIFKLLTFDGHEWIERDGPGQECTIGDIIVHNGTVYLIEPSNNCHYCHTTSLKSLLAANEPDWRSLDFPMGHSNLTVAGGHVVIVTHARPNMLHVLGFSTISNSWIELERKMQMHVIPSIVGTDNGRLLLMGRIKLNELIPSDPFQSLLLEFFTQFNIYELTATVTPYNPDKKISLSAVLKLELYANIHVLTQLYEQRKLGSLMERAGFSQSQMPLPLAILYDALPAAKCIKSWVDEKNPSLQPTWTNFLQILREPGINLNKTAGQIESYLQITGQETELSGMEELQVLRFQIESLYQFTTTSKDENFLSKQESCSKRCRLALHKLGGEQQRFMQRIEELQRERDQLVTHKKSPESKPKLSELQRLVKPHVVNMWEELGTVLGLADEDDGVQLDKIQESRNGDSGMCFNDTMKLWLRSGPSSQVTWATLIKAIKSIEGLGAVGAQIEAQLISSASGKQQMPCHPTESASPSQPTNPTPQLPPTSESSPTSASTVPADEVTFLPSDDTTTSSSDLGSPSPAASDEESSLSKPEGSCIYESDMSEKESVPDSFDYTLKLGPDKEIRKYQWELAIPGINGENYIVVAPTGSGKTLVAALVISKHLEKNQHDDKKSKVVFIVNTKPLAEQQKKELGQFIPGAHVGCSMGDGGPSIIDLLPHNDVIICTAGKLLDAIKGGKVTFDKISLIVIDECHHTKKSSPQANVMLRYLQRKAEDPSKVPQVMGLTASPGAGDNPHLDEKKTIDHLVNLCALMDATSGIKMVEENQEELDCNTNKPSFTLEIPPSRSEGEPFIQTIVHEMKKCEQTVPKFKCSFPKWSQEYETIVQQLKQELEISISPEYRDQISTLLLMRCYSQALLMYMDLTHDDAISVLEKYTDLPADISQATPIERDLKRSLYQLLIILKQLDPIENPLLNLAKEKLINMFSNNPSSKGILFVRTKKHALSICKWIKNLPESLHFGIKPRVITGHTRETGAGMTQVEQEEVMKSFRESGCNLLVATSVAEEGLDVPACNLVIRFQHVSSEIAKKQTLGRARAEESEGFTILASNSRKKLQELKNDELLRLVEECMQWFPKGQHLKVEIEMRQKGILTHHRQKIAVRRQITSEHDPRDFQMRCKRCKTLACAASDVYLIDGTFHHAVPDESFKVKIKKRPHKTPRQLTEIMAQTHKIFCASCDSEWGIMAIWPAKGKEFPVLKCKQFIFESNAQPRSIKKWSDAPFELSGLSKWFDLQNQSSSEEQ